MPLCSRADTEQSLQLLTPLLWFIIPQRERVHRRRPGQTMADSIKARMAALAEQRERIAAAQQKRQSLSGGGAPAGPGVPAFGPPVGPATGGLSASQSPHFVPAAASHSQVSQSAASLRPPFIPGAPSATNSAPPQSAPHRQPALAPGPAGASPPAGQQLRAPTAPNSLPVGSPAQKSGNQGAPPVFAAPSRTPGSSSVPPARAGSTHLPSAHGGSGSLPAAAADALEAEDFFGSMGSPSEHAQLGQQQQRGAPPQVALPGINRLQLHHSETRQ